MEEFVDFNNEKKVRDYSNKIRTEINNGLEDLRKRDTNFSDMIFREEIHFFNSIKSNFRTYCKNIPEEEVKRLSNLIEIYSCLKSLSDANYCFKNNVNSLNFLVNGD